MEANWKQIANYEKYEVSDQGQIRTIKNKRLLKFVAHKQTKVLRVCLCKDSKPKWFYVHPIVGQMFIDGYQNQQLSHINKDFKDNRVASLKIR
ncbi:NUMOD4 motif-containing homing endonuclease [Tetrahymena thermophila SB210]|uniref:NUMOD4 motif-containing homing endonuclease n=1 Tax=Tetrahymena thermophila (strain SB210) TaxID=312017 RepID=A0A1B9C293_TETTS|nr:NUMOD4 motif-containing homing endonuclease [Tetrahymena thermophila SB210]